MRNRINWDDVVFKDKCNGVIEIYSKVNNVSTYQLKDALNHKKRQTGSDNRSHDPYLTDISFAEEKKCVKAEAKQGEIKRKLNHMFRNIYPNGLTFEFEPKNHINNNKTINIFLTDSNSILIKANGVPFGEVYAELEYNEKLNALCEMTNLSNEIMIFPKQNDEANIYEDTSEFFFLTYSNAILHLDSEDGYAIMPFDNNIIVSWKDENKNVIDILNTNISKCGLGIYFFVHSFETNSLIFGFNPALPFPLPNMSLIILFKMFSTGSNLHQLISLVDQMQTEKGQKPVHIGTVEAVPIFSIGDPTKEIRILWNGPRLDVFKILKVTLDGHKLSPFFLLDGSPEDTQFTFKFNPEVPIPMNDFNLIELFNILLTKVHVRALVAKINTNIRIAVQVYSNPMQQPFTLYQTINRPSVPNITTATTAPLNNNNNNNQTPLISEPGQVNNSGNRRDLKWVDYSNLSSLGNNRPHQKRQRRS